MVPRKELEALEKKLAEQNEEALKAAAGAGCPRRRTAGPAGATGRVRAAAEAAADTHDYSEAETRRYLIDVDLRRAGWPLDKKRDREYEVTGMPNNKGIGLCRLRALGR